MSDSDNNFASFMTSKTTKNEGASKSIIGGNKTQEALDQKKQEKEDEKKKELDDAKKNSIALANRYGKGDMMKMQARNTLMMLPFILLGALIVVILVFKGGDWLRMGMNGLFNVMTGSK